MTLCGLCGGFKRLRNPQTGKHESCERCGGTGADPAGVRVSTWTGRDAAGPPKREKRPRARGTAPFPSRLSRRGLPVEPAAED